MKVLPFFQIRIYQERFCEFKVVVPTRSCFLRPKKEVPGSITGAWAFSRSSILQVLLLVPHINLTRFFFSYYLQRIPPWDVVGEKKIVSNLQSVIFQKVKIIVNFFHLPYI